MATLALALLSWRFDTLVPGIDSDWSWVAGLETIAHEQLAFGDQLIWNYGPLGFLHLGAWLYYDDVAVVAFLYHWVLQVSLAATLYVAARRSYPAPVAFTIAFLVITLAIDRALLLGFAWCVLALMRVDDAPRDALARCFPFAVGVLAGILVLAKINQGVEIVAIAIVTLIARPGRRPIDAAVFLGTLLTTAATGWLATGQTPGDIWPYVRYAAETIGGYPAAAGSSNPEGQWHYPIALLVFVLGSALVWQATRNAAPIRRWGMVTVWLLFSLATFKQGFVRHGDGHVRLYATGMLMALAVLPVKATGRWFAIAGAGIVSCLALYGLVMPDLGDRLNPYDNARAAVAQAQTLTNRRDRERRRSDLIDSTRDHYLAPPSLTDMIGDRTTAFWPFANGDLAYALGVHWRPLPVMEPYGISTPALDSITADMLASSRGPERILRRPRPIPNVDHSPERPARTVMFGPRLDPPLTTRAMFCRYRELARSEPWQLLARGPNRCGEPRKIGTVVTAWGETIDIPEPRPGTAILAQIAGVDTKGTERLKALWLRPDARMISLDGRPYRLVPSTASSGHLLRAAPDVDYAPPLALAPNPSMIAVHRITDQPDDELRYTFLELPVRGD